LIHIDQVFVVEGRYDRNKLSQIFDAAIIETDGFGIFKQPEKMELLRHLAETRGIIVFTDSDGAGFLIRNRIKSAISTGNVFHAYIPDIYGKEKRKRASSKEGKLGVEGVSNQVIIDAVQRCGIEMTETPNPKGNKITKQDLYALGLSGRSNSAVLRKAVIQKLQLPEHLSANGFLEVVNLLYTTEELQDIVDKI
jgi:ribonuclease M5